MYDEKGQAVWETRLDIYGKVHTFAGRSLSDCPFRYQGQYEDSETGLYYNRFRYYDSSSGCYLSQDPIGLAGNNPTMYGYVKDPNSWLDVFGLDCMKSKNLNKNGEIISNKTTKKGITKEDRLFANRNDANNWASQQLGHDKTRMYDNKGKWIGWQNSKGDKVYWGHNDWGKGVGNSTYPHLNYSIGDNQGHLFLRDKIINRNQWDEFTKSFNI
jgi:RHS repeat-associated protein